MSRKSTDKPITSRISDKSASEKTRTPWGERIQQVWGGKSQTKLAELAGINQSTLNDAMNRGAPTVENAVRIAQALDVSVEWLITGKERAAPPALIAADEADWVIVPHYRLGEFTETGKPDPIETVPLRKDWLNRNARASTNLWLTELPATLIEGLGEEGDTILCRDAQVKEGEGTYLYLYDGLPIVRRFEAPKLGMAEPQNWAWEPEDPPGMRIVARILGTIKLRPC